MNKSGIMKAAELAKGMLQSDWDGSDSLGFKLREQQVALIAAAELLKQVEWQPIENAPRDGTRILIALRDYQNEMWVDIAHYGKTPALGCSDNWRNCNGQGYSWTPTHFMPLPQPPVIIEKEGV